MWDESRPLPVMEGLANDHREVLITSVTDAAPLYRQKSASPSIWPIVAALAVTIMFIASIFTPWAVPLGSVLIGAALTGWFWPPRPRAKQGPLGTGA